MLKKIIINGEYGMIEGKYYHSANRNKPSILIIPPNPLYGGSMNNRIIYLIYQLMVKNQFSVLRFNFRGVGKSYGRFNYGKGELMDASICLDWIQNKNTKSIQYWVIGFSFGAWISMQLITRRPEITNFIIISPTCNSYDFNFIFSCSVSGLILQGSNDYISKIEYADYFYYKTIEQDGFNSYYRIIQESGHFFTKNIVNLINLISCFVDVDIACDGNRTRIVNLED